MSAVPVFELKGTKLIAVKLELKRTLELCTDISGCILSTVDGHDVVHMVRDSVETERLATINSSVLALAETLALEANQGLCRFVTIDNSNGRIVVLRVNRELVLMCTSGSESNLGMVLNVGQRTAAALVRML